MKNVYSWRRWRLVLVLTITGALANSSRAQVSYQPIASFGSPLLPGEEPHSGLIQGADGALYGTTQLGGSSNAGTVFKMNCDGSGYTVLHIFGGNDGQTPYGRLAQGANGNLFGTTVFGGTNGYGAVFTLDT